MRPAERLALAILLGLAVLVCGTAGAAAYAWHQSGSFRFAVHETAPDGVDLEFNVPGALVDAAIAVCPVPIDVAIDARFEAIIPALIDVAGRLAAMPDAVLVDIDDGGEQVRIAKSGGDLVIRVVSERERVELTIPVASVKRLAEKLGTRTRA